MFQHWSQPALTDCEQHPWGWHPPPVYPGSRSGRLNTYAEYIKVWKIWPTLSDKAFWGHKNPPTLTRSFLFHPHSHRCWKCPFLEGLWRQFLVGAWSWLRRAGCNRFLIVKTVPAAKQTHVHTQTLQYQCFFYSWCHQINEDGLQQCFSKPTTGCKLSSGRDLSFTFCLSVLAQNSSLHWDQQLQNHTLFLSAQYLHFQYLKGDEIVFCKNHFVLPLLQTRQLLFNSTREKASWKFMLKMNTLVKLQPFLLV